MPRSEFWPNPRVSTGVSSWCKGCHREATRKSREKHRDRYNAALRKPQESRSCAECGRRFETAIPHKRYCGLKCKKRAENRRSRAA